MGTDKTNVPCEKSRRPWYASRRSPSEETQCAPTPQRAPNRTSRSKPHEYHQEKTSQSHSFTTSTRHKIILNRDRNSNGAQEPNRKKEKTQTTYLITSVLPTASPDLLPLRTEPLEFREEGPVADKDELGAEAALAVQFGKEGVEEKRREHHACGTTDRGTAHRMGMVSAPRTHARQAPRPAHERRPWRVRNTPTPPTRHPASTTPKKPH
ncbi:hypothetical protein B0H13DRAFT_1861458 [Mycena leptocephala]|nr:hypothetical protein B0H13DRAFT_1861458 [Mycena leptocephala]